MTNDLADRSPRRDQAIVAVHLVLLRDDEVLLSLRRNTGYEDGNYSLVAGHVEPGETALQGISREAREEAGIDVQPGDLRLIHLMHRRETANATARLDLFFAADRWRGEIENREPDKCGELRWTPRDQLPVNLVSYVAQALAAWQSGQPYSERWFTTDSTIPDPDH